MSSYMEEIEVCSRSTFSNCRYLAPFQRRLQPKSEFVQNDTKFWTFCPLNFKGPQTFGPSF